MEYVKVTNSQALYIPILLVILFKTIITSVHLKNKPDENSKDENIIITSSYVILNVNNNRGLC